MPYAEIQRITWNCKKYWERTVAINNCTRCGKPFCWGQLCRACYRKKSQIRLLIQRDSKARRIWKEMPMWPYKDCNLLVKKLRKLITNKNKTK